MDRTSASHLVPNKNKQTRNAIWVRAMDAASLPLNEEIFDRIFSDEWNGLLSSVELGLFLRKRFCFLHTVCYFHHYFKRARTQSPLVRTHDWPSGCLRPQGLSFETIWHTAIVHCLPIASISHGTSLMSIPGKAGHIDLVRGRRPSNRLPIWTYSALSLGCSTTSVISRMKSSTRHKILRSIIFLNLRPWP
jgi:hypothetical protein